LPDSTKTLKEIKVLIEGKLLTAILNRIEIKKGKVKVFIQEKGKYIDIRKMVAYEDKGYFEAAKKEYRKILDSQQKNKKTYFKR